MIVYDPIEDCSRCADLREEYGAEAEADARASQWCTLRSHGPARWEDSRDPGIPRHYMGGRVQGGMLRPPETREEWNAHGCLGSYSRSPFVLGVEKYVRRKGRANRLYDQADDHVIELVHYYERHLDAVEALGQEMCQLG